MPNNIYTPITTLDPSDIWITPQWVSDALTTEPGHLVSPMPTKFSYPLGYNPTFTDPLRYLDFDQMNRRLNHTIVRYRGKICEVQSWRPDTLDLVVFYLEGTVDNHLIHSSDIDLDISSVPLGFINYKESSFYIQRIPIRRQTQGVSPEVCYFHPIHKKTKQANGWNLLKSKDFVQCANNKYPKFLSIFKGIKDNKILSGAFHKRFALVQDDLGIVKIKHLTDTIGWIPPKEEHVILPDSIQNPIFQKFFTSIGVEVR